MAAFELIKSDVSGRKIPEFTLFTCGNIKTISCEKTGLSEFAFEK